MQDTVASAPVLRSMFEGDGWDAELRLMPRRGKAIIFSILFSLDHRHKVGDWSTQHCSDPRESTCVKTKLTAVRLKHELQLFSNRSQKNKAQARTIDGQILPTTTPVLLPCFWLKPYSGRSGTAITRCNMLQCFFP